MKLFQNAYKNETNTQNGFNIWTFKGATGLYKPVGGAGASFCLILSMLHNRDPCFKIKKYLQII